MADGPTPTLPNLLDGVGLVTVDREQRIAGCSPGAAKLLGQEVDAVVGQPLSRWLRPSLEVERSELPDGGTVVLLRERRVPVVERLGGMLSALPDPHYVFDSEGCQAYATPAADRVLGPSPAVLEEPRRKVQETGVPVWGELSSESGDFDYVITPVFEDGSVAATIVTLRDVTERHRAEAALRLAISHAPVPAMIFAEDGEVLLLSEAWERLSGYSPDELPTLGAWTERAYGKKAREVERNVLGLFDLEGPTEEGEFTIRTRDGDLRIWKFRSSPIGRTADGRRMMLSMASDQTELRESERRFRAIFDSSALGISQADLGGHLVVSNPALQRMLGYSGEELSELTFREVTHPDDLQAGIELFEQLVAGQRTTYEVDKRYVRKDGSVFWARLTASLVQSDEGLPQFVVGLVEDITERRERAALFRATFEEAGAGMVLADAEGRFLSTNRQFQRFVGYSAEELRSRPFPDITFADDVGLDWGLFEELRAGKRDRYEIEKRYVRSDGALVWGRLIGTAIRDDAGHYQYGLGMIEDVTARKEAEKAQHRLIAILEATPDAVGIADAEGRTIYMNAATRAMLGLDDDEDVSRRPIASYHPEWAASLVLREGLPTAAREGIWRGETAMLARDGAEIPVSQVIVAHREEGGQIRYFSSILHDISERKRAEQAQRFLLDASRTLSGSLDLGATLEGLVRLVVPARADFCFVDLIEHGGLKRMEAVHRDPGFAHHMRELCRFADVSDCKLGVPEVLRTGEPLLVHEVTEPWLRAVARDAEHLDLLRALSIRSQMIVALRARGRVIGAITFGSVDRRYGPDDLLLARDLCTRAGLALENARLYRDAQRATSLRDEVLRVVAHDLRNPLVSIALATEVVRRTLPDEALHAAQQLDTIRRSVDQANRLIQDLLDVAKMEAGRLTVETRTLSPGRLVEEALARHTALAEHRGIELVPEVFGGLPDIQADEHRILQVFSNLIGNALKFTPAGGKITLGAEPAGDAVAFEVRDTGPGIPEVELPHVFEMFWQSAAVRGTGAGLGLSIVRGIVEAHGGEVSVQSGAGRGTTVRFRVPTSRPRPPRDPRP